MIQWIRKRNRPSWVVLVFTLVALMALIVESRWRFDRDKIDEWLVRDEKDK